MRPGRRKRVLFRIAALLFGLILAALAAEVALRAFPEALLGADLTGALYDPYNTTPFGIYFWEPRAKMNVMWPSLELEAYSHGHFWKHRTDARGFRNPPDRQATGILLLGDSMIYGHGVEDDQTVASFLRREHGYPAYNMARQGDCLYQHYRLLRLYLDELSPRTVLLFAFTNDLTDLAKTDAFASLDRPSEIEDYDYAAIRRSIERTGRSRPSVPFLSRFVLWRLATERRAADGERPGRDAKRRKLAEVMRVLGKLGFQPGDGKPLDVDQVKRIVALPRYRDRLEKGWRALDADDLERAGRYYRRILRDLHRRCRERGATLVLVNLALDQGEFWRDNVDQAVADLEKRIGLPVTAAAKKYVADLKYDARLQMAAQVGKVVAEVAGEDGIDYLDLSARFKRRDNYLENDGHLSELGHRRLAEHLHAFLSRKK
jgi:hypothetical protein